MNYILLRKMKILWIIHKLKRFLWQQITQNPFVVNTVMLNHGPLALDALLVPKISKRHFFQDIKNSFHGVTRMGLEPHQNFFQNFFSTNMVARGVQSFCILEGATDPLIEQ